MSGMLRDQKGQGMVEFAFVAPVLLLITLALVNLAMVGMAGVSANDAANYGARVGSVAQSNAAGYARNAALAKLNAAGVGTYAVQVQAIGSSRGGLMRVAVTYRVPNYFRGLAAMFGANMPAEFEKTAVSYFRREGW